jgi:flagellar basal-body rod protein FlgC
MPNPIGGTPDARGGRPMFSTLRIASSGLSAQRLRMDTIATNIANAETTRTEGGGPYRRRVVNMEAGDARSFGAALAASEAAATTNVGAPVPGSADESTAVPKDLGGVRVSSITEDASEGPKVYDPFHPHADASGFVHYPNVRVTDEIVDLMDAKRVFEANATVFQAAKSMLRRAIDI